MVAVYSSETLVIVLWNLWAIFIPLSRYLYTRDWNENLDGLAWILFLLLNSISWPWMCIVIQVGVILQIFGLSYDFVHGFYNHFVFLDFKDSLCNPTGFLVRIFICVVFEVFPGNPKNVNIFSNSISSLCLYSNVLIRERN